MKKNKAMAAMMAVCMTAMVWNTVDFAGAAITASAATKESSEWLPDICSAFDTEGEYYDTVTGTDEVEYDLYIYEFVGSIEDMSKGIVIYGEALKDLDYEVIALERPTGMVKCQAFEKGDYHAELQVYLGGTESTEEIAAGADTTWTLILAVPTGMEFTLGSGPSGVANGEMICIGCHGSGICDGCGGIGTVTYYGITSTCPNCGGTGICNICDGEGSY